jgi:hypothetical protein
MNSITKLASLLFVGGVVCSSGIQKRVLVSTPNSGTWYAITAKYQGRKLEAVTVRREDANLETPITELEARVWINRLQEVRA